MKPSFALNLSHDGIGLLRRDGEVWVPVGEVSLDDPEMSRRLSALRRLAHRLAPPEGMLTKVVIPASQVLYLDVAAPGPSPAVRRSQIERALDGVTPYPVEELIFDWSGRGDEVQVAIVARETLAEAETYAEDWGFAPVCFVAVPPEGAFGGEPWFGLTSVAGLHVPEGKRISRDQDPIPAAAFEAVRGIAVELPPDLPAATLPDGAEDPTEAEEPAPAAEMP